MKTLIGLSMSFCIADILAKRIDIGSVICIVTNTAFKTPEEALDYYYDNHWKNYECRNETRDLLKVLWSLIYQPRLNNTDVNQQYNIGFGHWVNTSNGTLNRKPVN